MNRPTRPGGATNEPAQPGAAMADQARPSGAVSDQAGSSGTAAEPSLPSGGMAPQHPSERTIPQHSSGATAQQHPSGGTTSQSSSGATPLQSPSGATTRQRPSGVTTRQRPSGATTRQRPSGAMGALARPWGTMHFRTEGPADAPRVVLANSLGTDLRLWDAVLPLLPPVRAIRYDKPGHGLSDTQAEVSIAGLAEDAIALLEAEGGGPAVFVGLSIGGLIGQAAAAARPDLFRGIVLSNTAARIGTAESWNARIGAVRTAGIASIADTVMERWFAAPFRAGPELPLWRNMLLRTPTDGYAAACAAIAAADLTAATAGLRLPALVIAGSEDGSTPPDLVAATAALIPGARFEVIPGAGHLPCVETPAAHAALITRFLQETGHV